MGTSVTMVSILTVLICVVFVHADPGGDAIAPPSFTINLDLPEEQRWVEVVTKYKQLVPDIYDIMKKFLPDPKISIPIIQKIAAGIDDYLSAPYAGEMRGIATALNISVGDVVLCNLLYDISAFCTSIVMQDVNGLIWHARNLDYGFTDILRNITIRVDFQKGGKTVYSGITYAGYVGLLTGQRPNVFTLTVDERVYSGITYAGYVGLVTGQRPNVFTLTMDERDQGAWWMNILIGIVDRRASPVSFLLRDTLASSQNFSAAVNKIAYTTTEASFYTIMGGTQKGEGIVITKGRLGPVDLWKIDADSGRWFNVETNYDHWVPPPADDDRRDPAIKAMNAMGQSNISKDALFKVMSTPPVMNKGFRDPAIKAMNAMGQSNISKDALFNVMSTPPVMNKDTTYTVVMSAAQPDIMQAWIRYP